MSLGKPEFLGQITSTTCWVCAACAICYLQPELGFELTGFVGTFG